MIRLGVNIDHVATVRNARGENYPDPNKAALMAKRFGASSITIHLREDRRHINDKDVLTITKNKSIPTNLEIAATNEMIKIISSTKPNYVCIVPEKRKEITTEGGLNIKKNKKFIQKMIMILKKNKVRVSLFIEPKINDIKLSRFLGANCVELHTGNFCNLFNKDKKIRKSYLKLRNAANYAKKIGLEVHAGHGLTYKSAFKISKIRNISEFNIGHFLISESLFCGLNNAIKRFKKVINT